MPFPEPQRTEVDGVPLWFTDVPGPCMGGLIFRVGKCDETLVTSGINHIIEHLALAPFVPGRLDMNGSTTPLTTRFVVSGDQGSVEAFLMQVCQNLSALPYERLDLERRVLQTEGQQRGGSFGGIASVRFGARGIGVVDWMEVGLEHLTADQLEAWRLDRFTKANAVAWMTRPPSPALWLPLPEGARQALPDVAPLDDITLPSHTHSDPPHIGCSFLAPRSMPLFVAMQIVRSRLLARLRIDRGLTYSIGYSEERVGLQDSLFFVSCDTPEGHTADAVREFVGTLDEVADGNITEESVLLTYDALMPWKATDPRRPALEAERKAVGDLIGHTPTTWTELATQAEALGPPEVASALEAALGSAILSVPEEEDVPERFRPHPTEPVKGFVLGRLFVRWDGNAMDQVVFGDNGVSRSLGPSSSAIDFDECELAAFAPNGTVWLVNARGDGLFIELNQLVKGTELAAAIRERIPERIVDIRGDALGWFELQSMVEEHDSISVRTMWRELETLALLRKVGERVVLLALADHGKRGILALTDRRLVHVSHARKDAVVVTFDRAEIQRVGTTTGLLGVRLEIRSRDQPWHVFERIRPRASAAEFELALTPVERTDDRT